MARKLHTRPPIKDNRVGRWALHGPSRRRPDDHPGKTITSTRFRTATAVRDPTTPAESQLTFHCRRPLTLSYRLTPHHR